MAKPGAWQGGGERIENGAVFSPCKIYRYTLWRVWDRTLPLVNFVMLNPSTADEVLNDPTVERCERRARKMGYGGLIVTNAFALRSTDPKGLRRIDDPVGPENDHHISVSAAQAALVVCGWGKHCDAVAPGRGNRILQAIHAGGRVPHALKLNGDGSPQHPLYIGYATLPRPMPGERIGDAA